MFSQFVVMLLWFWSLTFSLLVICNVDGLRTKAFTAISLSVIKHKSIIFHIILKYLQFMQYFGKTAWLETYWIMLQKWFLWIT